MLDQLAHPMATPFSTRRSAQAALALLSLIGGKGSAPHGIEVRPSHLRVHLEGFTLWVTRCDPPLLLDEAAVLAAAARCDILIARLAASPRRTIGNVASPVSVDWVRAGEGGDAISSGLAPALPHGGGLALVDSDNEQLRIDVTDKGIVACRNTPPGWPLQRELAAARAAAILHDQLWGGL